MFSFLFLHEYVSGLKVHRRNSPDFGKILTGLHRHDLNPPKSSELEQRQWARSYLSASDLTNALVAEWEKISLQPDAPKSLRKLEAVIAADQWPWFSNETHSNQIWVWRLLIRITKCSVDASSSGSSVPLHSSFSSVQPHLSRDSHVTLLHITNYRL